jgi:hypothetical protein
MRTGIHQGEQESTNENRKADLPDVEQMALEALDDSPPRIFFVNRRQLFRV